MTEFKVGDYPHYSGRKEEFNSDFSRMIKNYPFVAGSFGRKMFSLISKNSRLVNLNLEFEDSILKISSDEELNLRERNDLEYSLGLNGFSFSDNKLIHLPIIEEWMMPDIKSSRGEGVNPFPILGSMQKAMIMHSTDVNYH